MVWRSECHLLFVIGILLVSCLLFNSFTQPADTNGTPGQKPSAPAAGQTAKEDTNLYRASYNLRGMMSVTGADKLEKYFKKSPGVVNARKSFFTNEAWIVFRPDVTSASSIEKSIDRVSNKWPYPLADLKDQKQINNASLSSWKEPSQELVNALRKELIPEKGSKTPAGFTLTLNQAAKFIAYNDQIRNLPEKQQAVIKEALDFVIVCCPPFKAWPC